MTSRHFLSFFWILFLFLGQNTMGCIFPQAVFPLLMVGVIYYALTDGPAFGAVMGCFAGFLLDILGAGKLGSSMTLYSVLGIAAGFSSTKIFFDSFFTQMTLPTLGYFMICLINLFLVRNFGGEEKVDLGIIKESFIISQPWFTIISSLGVFWFLKKLAAPRYSRRIAWKNG